MTSTHKHLASLAGGALLIGIVTFTLGGAGEKLTPMAPVPVTNEYRIDPVHASAVFRVKHLGVSNFYGRFNEVSGSFRIDAENPEKSSLVASAKVGSLDTNNKDRDKHVLSPDFLDAKLYPSISYKATSFKKTGTDRYEVTGDLTLLGKTLPVPGTLDTTGSGKGMQGENLAGVEVRLSIKRSAFGMDKLIPAVSDEVEIIVAVEGQL